MSEQNKIIGKRIKERRKELKMTQKELGEKIGCAEITIRQYENGRYSPKIDTRIALANALSTSYVDLFVPDQTAIAFDSPEDFKKVWASIDETPKNGYYQTVVHHKSDGTITNEAQYRFEAADLSEREYKVFDNLYSLLRNKDANAPD